jgi:hypothetical protein
MYVIIGLVHVRRHVDTHSLELDDTLASWILRMWTRLDLAWATWLDIYDERRYQTSKCQELLKWLENIASLLQKLRIYGELPISVVCRDSSVGIVLGYGLDDRGYKVRFPAGAESFSLHHRVQNCSGTHLSSYPMGTRGSFPGGKEAGAWIWPLTFI